MILLAHPSTNCSLTAMLHLAKEKQMTKTIRCCLLFLMMGSPALAGAHYVEVWNPPEAHGNIGLAQPVHKIPKRQSVSVRPVQRRLHHRVAAVAPVSERFDRDRRAPPALSGHSPQDDTRRQCASGGWAECTGRG
ncbi:conserved hypothetical protein [Paraburkholderia caribensis]|nr:conserved hypothetical protein [Paraburkholderia caribensis]